ncbi:MAG: hypothetical protein JSU70_13240 [Phycisphaerales bacterium]|nr:MAG: hypothetical protein JSU70_13240 [Phycisphaerales bacterium]
MERLRILFWIVVCVAAVVIVWRVGFYPIEAGLAGNGMGARTGGALAARAEAEEPAEANEPAVKPDADAPEESADANEPEEPDKPGEPNKPAQRIGPDRQKPDEPNKPSEPNEVSESGEPMEAVNLTDVEVKKIIAKIADWTGKAVLPDEEVIKQKVTIYAPKKVPRSKALSLIYSALLMKGYVAEETEDRIYLKPITEARLGLVPTIPAEQPLAMVENKEQVAQRFIRLDNYNPAQMIEIIQPLVGEHGYITADESTSRLLVIDTVANLMRLERIVEQFDVPEAEQAKTQIFDVRYGDPTEIVQMLNILLGETEGRSSRYSRDRDRDRRFGSSRFSGPPRPPSGSSPTKKSDSKSGAASSVVITSGDVPVVLIPEPRRKWIIAKASAEGIKMIGEWIKELDKEEPVESEYEIVQLKYADPREVESSIEDGFQDMPGTEFLPSILIEPLEQTNQVMVFGRKELREMVKKMIAEIDIPPGDLLTEIFPLEHADPDEIKENLDGLYEQQSGRFSSYSARGYSSRTVDARETVKVISFPTMGQVTVIASPDNMEKIRKQIKEWDVPLDVNEVRPRIITLRNTDPVQLAELLQTLFSEDSSSSRFSIFDLIYGRSQERQKIVGPLYGQLTFENVPGTKKIIVISKIPAAYDVIEELIRELDEEEMAEVPRVIEVKYANVEKLAELLNALFNEQGTTATIQRSDGGLSEYTMEETDQSGDGGGGGNQGDQGGSSGEYRPWWNTGRQNINEEPISNVIGRVRFIPDPRSKSLLVLAPPEFMESIEATIKELDIPGKQVMLKAVVVEVSHSKVTSLGVQLATDPAAFGTLGENSIEAIGQLTALATDGAITTGAGGVTTGTGTVLGVNTNVYALVDFLVKTTNAKILNQQTLWTKDNEEADFFKGSNIAFQTDTSVSQVSGMTTSSYAYERVGMALQARPSITPEKKVDMIVKVMLSQLTPQMVNNVRVRTEMETTTNMIVPDGQTLMLGGILFQEDSLVERKVPLFGDVPVVGGLFRHNDVVASNNEMIIFITPYVIDDGDTLSTETVREMERPKEKLKDVQDRLKAMLEKLENLEPVD